MDSLKVTSDFSYAFHIFQNEEFIKLIQSIVRRDPANLDKIGSLLIKMRTVLDDTFDDSDERGKYSKLKSLIFIS